MPTQLSLSFEPGLTSRYPHLEDAILYSVYASRHGVTGIAAQIDMAQSELSKRLTAHQGDDEKRPLRVKDMVRILEATGDFTPVYWLIERYLKDPTAKRQEAIEQISSLLPMLSALVEAATEGGKVRAVR